MHEYRVTKDDPKYRENGAYTRPEWTSIADVGQRYDGHIFNMADYERAEKQHIDFLVALATREASFPLTIQSLEDRRAESPWAENQQITADALPAIVRDVLREECWCRLEATDFFIHFGYDYYMYVGCTHTTEAITALAASHALYAEPMQSPYHP